MNEGGSLMLVKLSRASRYKWKCGIKYSERKKKI